MSKIYTLLFFVIVVLSGCNSDNEASDNVMSDDQSQMGDAPLLTAIPDEVFEQFLIDNNLDDVLDGEVRTSNLTVVTSLILDDLNIIDLTGINDFPNLDNLWLQNTNLTDLDVSENALLKFLYFDNNNISTIDVSLLSQLEKLSFRNNEISNIDVSNNTNLQLLDIIGNDVSALDVSLNNELFTLNVTDNPLNCIKVNETQFADIPINWVKENDDTYALDCN